MSFYNIKSVQKLPISLDEAWSFFSSPKNLDKITPDKMSFVITNNPEDSIYQGQIITYKVAPFLGIKLNWMTEITTVNNKNYFIDEQRFGPYAFWHHRHSFEETDDGVIMKDEVNYKLPMGILGTIAHKIFVKKQLNEVFEYRRLKLIELFGEI
ncbi:MAG: SRPBCC family protein [Bacteroidia bacterium]